MFSFVISATLFFIKLVLCHCILFWIHSLLFLFHKLLLLFYRHFHSFISSGQFSCTVMYDSLQRRGLHHARLPCPSPTPRACSNSCPSSQWSHPTISSSVVPFSSCLQSFPASGSFPMSQFFTSGGQNIGVSASAWVLPKNIQDWFPLGLTGFISLQSKGFSVQESKILLWHHSWKSSVLQHSAFFMVQLSWLLEKP